MGNAAMDKRQDQPNHADGAEPSGEGTSGEGTSSGRAMRLLVAYKLTRGGLQLLGASILLVALSRSHGAVPGVVDDFVQFLVHHATPRWSGKIAQLALSIEAAHGHTLVWGTLALVADGAMTFLEGCALRLHKAWAEWLVVCTMGLPLPIELGELWRRPSAGHALLLVGNACIVAYLVRRRLVASA